MPTLQINDDAVVVDVGIVTGALVGRRRTRIPRESIRSATMAMRGNLEPLVDHRVIGVGPHDGKQRPGRRRVGSMLGREVRGVQFWAVEAGPPTQRLVVLDLSPPVRNFVRVVVSHERADDVVRALGGEVRPSG